MTQIKYYALNSIPLTPAETGSIYMISSGDLYVGTSTGTYKEFTSTLFVETLPEFGTPNKIYIHTEDGKAKLKVWNGLEYVAISNEVDLTPLQNDISVLTTKTNAIESDVSTLDGKVTALETELDGLDLTTIEANVLTNTSNISTINTKVSDLETDITTLESDMDNVDVKVLALETKVNELESAEIDLTPIQTQLDTIEGNVTTNTDDITTLSGKVSLMESELSTIESGQDGLSAYQIAVNNGFVGTETEWVESLKGQNGKDGINGINGSDANVTSENIESALGYKPASTASFNVTISSNWTGTVAPYTQTINVNGILTTDSPFAYPIYSSTNTTAINEENTWSKIGKITTNLNSVTVTCFEEKPTTALNIQLKVVR